MYVIYTCVCVYDHPEVDSEYLILKNIFPFSRIFGIVLIHPIYHQPQGATPQVISWFINHISIDISSINHSH